MGPLHVHHGAHYPSAELRPTVSILVLLLLGCGGEAKQAETNAQLCDRAAAHVESCGASTTPTVNCTYLTPDVACDNRCDLDVGCEYFRGNSPSESRSRAQCGSRCTCESAQRRTTECGLSLTFTCEAICNCPYSNDCEFGVPAYAECRAQCPPWPG